MHNLAVENNTMAVGSLCTLLQCSSAYFVILNSCQIEQHLCTLRTDDFGVLNEANCQSLSVTSQTEKASGVEHNPWGSL